MKKVSTYQRWSCLFLLALYTAGMLKVYVPYINYCVNYKYISTVLCVNKDKPMMHCNGKCHLKKTIKQAEQEDARSKSTIIKVFGFQEMPSTSLQLSFSKAALLQPKINAVIPCYLSPVLEINSPPPQGA